MKRLLLLFALAPLLCAQEFRSTLMGRVSDASGAAVVGAKVVVLKTDTNTRSETVTGEDGNYTMPFLAPGPYEVTVEVAGFKRYVHSGIDIGTNQRVAEDITLQVGNAAESVTVVAEVPLLTTVTASSGQVITTHEVENLPMNGNTPLALARNALGVIPKQKHLLNQVKPYDTASGVDISLGGANAGSNEYLLDGIPNMSSAARAGAFSPSMDAVDEVKVELFQSDAAYGDTLGGTVNITTKSGTNAVHGSAYEFNQVSALAANQYFLNAANQRAAVTRSNQYGGTLGGPVWIPRVFNGKDRLFFFFAYEGFKDSSPGVSTSSVPTQAERNGDFSALLAQGIQLHDPNTGKMVNGKVVRQQFNNNVIPPDRLSAVAKAYLQYFPLPNAPGKATGENNYVVPNPSVNNFASWIGRADAVLGPKNKLFFNMHMSAYTQATADIFHNTATGQYKGQDLWGGVLDDVHMFSPTLVLDTRFGFTRSYSYSSIKSAGFDATQLGFPGYMSTYSLSPAMPRISFPSAGAYAGLSTSPGNITPFVSYQLFSSATKVTGRHTIKGGADLRRYDANSLNPGTYAAGTFGFDNAWVNAGTGASNPAFGGPFAAFLLGLPTSGQFDVNTLYSFRSYLAGFFVQDDWRVKPNLTVNVGLRIEHETPVAERYNHIIVGLDPNAVNSVSAAAAAAYATNTASGAYAGTLLADLAPGAFSAKGGYIFASDNHRSGYSLPAFFPSPRLGVSWAPGFANNKTVFRGGFGIFNNSIGAYLTGYSPGYSQSTQLNPTNDSYLTPYATLNNPFPAGILTPVGSEKGYDTNLSNSVTVYNGTITNPYSIRWSFDVQQKLGNDMMLQIGYIGNKQVHMTNTNAISKTPLLPYLSRSLVRDQAAIDALGKTVPNPFYNLMPAGTSLNAKTLSVATLLQSFPQFTSVAVSNLNSAWGTFNELVVMFQKRFSHGLQASVNYQHARQLASAYQLNEGDTKLSYGVTSGDYPDHFVITGSYDLPFGQGKKFLSGANRLVDAIAGGWVLNSIYTWESGGAVQFGNIIYYGGDLNWKPRNLSQAFDVTRFERDSKKQLGQNYRTFPSTFQNLRNDAANNVDLSMLKNFRIRERMMLQYRFEAFNAFNRCQFDAPNVSPTSAAFATITNQANTSRQIQMGLKLKF